MNNNTELTLDDSAIGSYADYSLISSVFHILYERNGDSVSINKALQYICEKFTADRCFIFESVDKGKTYSNTFEWCKEDISKEINNLQNTPASFYQDLFDSAKDGVIYSNDLRAVFTTDAAYQEMAKQGIKSFVHSQVSKDGYVSFFLGLDDCSAARIWSAREIDTLQFISKIFSVILQGEHLREKLSQLSEYNKISAFVTESAEDLVYISDIDTYEIYYLNNSILNILGNPPESEWKGKKCYELLQGKPVPCEFCTNHLLNEKDFYEWTYLNPLFNKTYLLNDKLVPIRGKLARLEIATDITQVVSLENELKEKLEEESLLFDCIDTLHSGKDPHVSIDTLLARIAKYHDAERAYIFEFSKYTDLINNTHEWCAIGAEPQIHNLQNVPKDDLQTWYDKYEEIGEFYIDSLGDDVSKDSPEYELLAMQGITSLITAPLRDSSGVLTGFIGVDNPKRHKKQTLILRSAARFIATFLDETELLTELHKLSYYDTLTEIKNRHSFRKALTEIETQPIRSLGVAYIDIKGLGSINDAKGSDYGDTIIKRLAMILVDIFAKDVYRVGGDEFIVLKKDIKEKEFEDKIGALKERVLAEKDFTVSIGFTWNKARSDSTSYANLSDGEKYTAILSENLDREINDGKFVVFLQPQIDMKTGEFDGAEALIRRKDADGFAQAPISFIPFYEKEGIISKIDLFVCETVCKTLQSWREKGFDRDIKLSVNCSRMTVIEKDIVEQFTAICKKYGVKTSQIIIEITETISGSDDNILSKIITNFSDAGFSVSLDDFGSGYSNLSALKLSNFDEIKIDMGLTKALHTDKKSYILTKVALNLCDEFEGVVSVAEGIETKEQYEILKDLHCAKGQGYFFDKPLSIEDFTTKYII